VSEHTATACSERASADEDAKPAEEAKPAQRPKAKSAQSRTRVPSFLRRVDAFLSRR
jgi:hypothetical protein